MKKFTIAFLLALSATCIGIATGCGEDENPNGNNNAPTTGETRTITLEAGEGYSIVGDGVTYDEENDEMAIFCVNKSLPHRHGWQRRTCRSKRDVFL